MAVSRKKSINSDLLTGNLISADSLDGRIESDRDWRRVEGPTVPFVNPGPFAAVDFETFYSSKFSLSEMTEYEYVSHPAFNAYLVALELFDGHGWWRWVGHPEDAPWSSLPDSWVSHRAQFDELVSRKLRSTGVIARPIPDDYNCTSDLAGYFQLDRGLDACAPVLIGETADKSTRARMKSGGASAVAIRDYAGRDGRQCAWIWVRHHHRWPAHERAVSRLQRLAGFQGIWLDQPLMAEAKVVMRRAQLEVAHSIPWANRYPVASIKGVMIECAKLGIPPPSSLSLDDVDTAAWRDRHDSKSNWLEKIRRFTKAQQMESNVNMLQSRVRKDGTVPFELIYRKAPHTARFQSGGGLRMQNLDSDEVEGFNPRFFIHARPGHKFLIADLSQIEPRVLNWDVGDRVFLDACRKGASPYDAHAISTMGFQPKILPSGKPQRLKDANKGIYALAKARLLALGYQAWVPKFCEMARTMAQITVFEDETSYSPDLKTFYRASQIKDRIKRNDLEGWYVFPPAIESVLDFRDKSPLIADKRIGVWSRLENELRRHAGGDYFMPLPNGDVIRYFDVREGPRTIDGKPGELTAWVVKNSKNPHQKKSLYGGKLTENRVQRIARDILVDMIHRISRIDPKRLKYRWSVHDEIIAEAPSHDAKPLFDAMLHEMHTPPPWAKDLPVAAEGACEGVGILDHYVK